jgi:hypothetical protein
MQKDTEYRHRAGQETGQIFVKISSPGQTQSHRSSDSSPQDNPTFPTPKDDWGRPPNSPKTDDYDTKDATYRQQQTGLGD